MIHHDKVMKPNSNTLKPVLTEENKVARVEFCLQEKRGEGNLYNDFYDRVHVDDKWFYLTRVYQRYYLVDGEDGPHRTISHKNHIPKVMFLCAIAHPHFDSSRNQWFDGKIGMWPLAEQVLAKRNSRNRAAGTLVWKTTNINKDIYKT